MKKTVLIIEDNSEILENISELLELENYCALTAMNGKEGLEMALENSPKLILCDIMMPEMNGHELLTILKSDERTKNIPFIFVTAKSESRDVQKGMDLGAAAYLVKPFSSEELMKVVGDHCTDLKAQ